MFKGLLEGKTQKQAALDAGYSVKDPDGSAYQALQIIKDKAPDLFARHGLDDDSFIEKYLLPALNAQETKFFAHEGVVKDQRDVIAWGPRTNTNALVARMKGLIIENREAPSLQQTIKVVIVPTTICPPTELKNATSTTA